MVVHTEGAAMTVATVTYHQDGIWLTAMLRPAGELAGRAVERFVDEITALAQKANIVVVNLVAASVPSPAALARALRGPSAMLSGPDKALLLVGADDHLLREFEALGGDIDAI
jgi:hypothetical protein